jgi:hypothetical protein
MLTVHFLVKFFIGKRAKCEFICLVFRIYSNIEEGSLGKDSVSKFQGGRGCNVLRMKEGPFLVEHLKIFVACKACKSGMTQ